MHVCALVYAGTLSHACVYGEQKTRMYVSFTIYFMLSEIEGSLDLELTILKRLSGWRAPRSTFGGHRCTHHTQLFCRPWGSELGGLMLIQ